MKQSPWLDRMLVKYKTEEAVRAQMSEWGKKHGRIDYSSNYLKRMATEDPETLKQIQSERAKKRRK